MKLCAFISKLIGNGAVLLSIFFTGEGLLAAQGILSPQDYLDIQNVSEKIISQYPPDQYIYVGIGRSPTPVLAYMEARLGSPSVIHIPMGRLSLFTPGSSHYTAENQAIFDAYLQGHIETGLATNKKLLFIDFVFGGNTILNLKRELERHPDFERMKILALKNPHGVQRYLRMFKDNNIAYIRLPRFLERRLIDAYFDRSAKYQSFNIVEHGQGFLLPKQPVPNFGPYRELVSEIKGNLASAPKKCSLVHYLPALN